MSKSKKRDKGPEGAEPVSSPVLRKGGRLLTTLEECTPRTEKDVVLDQ